MMEEGSLVASKPCKTCTMYDVMGFGYACPCVHVEGKCHSAQLNQVDNCAPRVDLQTATLQTIATLRAAFPGDTNMLKLADYYEITADSDFSVITCKGCGKRTMLVNTDRAGYARAINHGFSHKASQQPELKPVK
jgi:hypothetical protein